jgi:hypothetical protein
MTKATAPEYAPPGPFVDPRQLSYTKLLEANFPEIRQELLAVIGRKRWSPYLDRKAYRGTAMYLLLYARGRKNPSTCRLCPVTTKVLEAIPNIRQAVFGFLGPGAYISPHRGTAGVLRVHLGLIAEPGKAAWRVGGETRECVEGKVTVFEDGCLHEAWNRGESHRVTLICDPPAPHLRPDEVPKVLENYEKEFGAAYLLDTWAKSKPPGHPFHRFVIRPLLALEPIVTKLDRVFFPAALFFYNRFSARRTPIGAAATGRWQGSPGG